MAQYGRVDYWNERYSVDLQSFEWYQRYDSIKHLLANETLSRVPSKLPHKNNQRVLVIGCGNSELSQLMQEDGYSSVTSIDFSAVVIEQMKEKYSNGNYIVMDATAGLDFADDSFDLIIMKGSFDAILCGSGSLHSVRATLLECSRVLGAVGTLVIVTHATPENRLAYIEDPGFGWNIDVHKIPKPILTGANPPSSESAKFHYVYILGKGAPLDEEVKVSYLEKSQENQDKYRQRQVQREEATLQTKHRERQSQSPSPQKDKK